MPVAPSKRLELNHYGFDDIGVQDGVIVDGVVTGGAGLVRLGVGGAAVCRRGRPGGVGEGFHVAVGDLR